MKNGNKVGIWWFWKGEVFDFSVLLSDTVEIEGFSNGPVCHVDAWPDFQKMIPELAYLDYSDIPRGRIIAKNRIQFVLYASKELIQNKDAMMIILKRFNLDKASTVLRADEHYEKTVLREELPPLQNGGDELEGLYKEFPELKEL